MLRFGYFSCNFLVVPGVTVDLNNTILSSLSLTSEMSCNACSTISKFIDPSLFDGVGTDKNINSDSFTVSSIVSTDLVFFTSMLRKVLNIHSI